MFRQCFIFMFILFQKSSRMIVEIVIIVILSNWSAEHMYMYIVTEGVPII